MEATLSTTSVQFQGDHVLPRECLQPILGKLASHELSSAIQVSSLTAQARRGEISCYNGGGGNRGDIRMVLENEELWKQFHDIPNEMIVTKIGRRMFPLVQVTLSGLNPSLHYVILLEFQLTDNHRWRFLNGEWTATGSFTTSEPPLPSSVYVHTSSPLTGREWMRQKVVFSKVKLSNKEDGIGKVKLVSLYRYQPCIHVIQLDQPGGMAFQSSASSLSPVVVATHRFRETQFIAVTAYQNDKITQMKIKHNPFAKAFLGSQDSILHTRVARPQDLLSSGTPCSVYSSTYVQFQSSHQAHPAMHPNTTSTKRAASYPFLGTSTFPSLLTEAPSSTCGPTHQVLSPQPSSQTWNTISTTDSSEFAHVTSAYFLHQEYLTNAAIANCCHPVMTFGIQSAPTISAPSCPNHQQVLEHHQPQQKCLEQNNLQVPSPMTCTSNSYCNISSDRSLKRNGFNTQDFSYQEKEGYVEGTEICQFQATTLSNT